MNYNLFAKISILLIIISTLCICITKPQMHKSLLVFNSDYTVVEQKVETNVETNLPTTTQLPQKEVKTTKINTPVTKQEETKTPAKTIKKEPQVQKITTQTTQKPKNTTKKMLTAKEEEIAWNIWRSKLQNQIMKDVNMPILPQGTVFKFTFDVDKYGKISNVQTWSLTSSYTPYAIQYIAPVIRSYQGKSILDFPAGSNRITTQVEGGWKIATTQRYSTPQDYNDTEKIKK